MSRFRTVHGPLDKVLFVRTSRELLDMLDAIAERESALGSRLSRSDIARVLLWEQIEKEKGRSP